MARWDGIGDTMDWGEYYAGERTTPPASKLLDANDERTAWEWAAVIKRVNQVRAESFEPLLPGSIDIPAPVYRGPGMSSEFRARGQALLEAKACEVPPAPPRVQRDGRHAAYYVSLAFPVCFAIIAAAVGDLRLCAILCLMTMFIAVVGLFVLDR